MNFIQKSFSCLLTSKGTKQLYVEFDILFRKAQQLNLAERDLAIAREYFKHREYALSLDHITTQFYEFDLPIDDEFHGRIYRLAKMMNIPGNTYQYLDSLLLKP